MFQICDFIFLKQANIFHFIFHFGFPISSLVAMLFCSVYLVGTEEGPIYKCDRSYSEQYMQMYMGHNGPVYQVGFSHPLYFLYERPFICWGGGEPKLNKFKFNSTHKGVGVCHLSEGPSNCESVSLYV
jgi:hypothetical protein